MFALEGSQARMFPLGVTAPTRSSRACYAVADRADVDTATGGTSLALSLRASVI